MFSSSRPQDNQAPVDYDYRQSAMSATSDYGPDNRDSRYDDVASEGYDSRRESYLDPSHGHLQPLTHSGGSSRMDDDRNSNESGSGSNSSGTKVNTPIESRSPSAYRAGSKPYNHQGGARHDGSDMSGQAWQGPSSDSSHENAGTGLYQSRGYSDSTGYVDQPMYHPSSPSSAQSHGSPAFDSRYRDNSYSGSGLNSARASTIGTDHIPSMPYNSSRTALNHEWQNSADLDGIAVAPGKDHYGAPRHDRMDSYGTEKDGPATYVPIPPSSPAMNASMNEKAGGMKPDGGRQPEPAVVLSRANRLAWIDGLRGLASVVIFTHHFADLTWAATHPRTLEWGYYQSFVRNGQLAVAMYFLLGGRVLAHSFLRSAYVKPKAPKDSHGDPIPGAVAPKWTGPKWLSLSSSLFRRSIRLALPAVVVGFLQWQLSDANYFTDAMQAQAILDTDALWTPNWHYIGGFVNFLRFVIDLFTNSNHKYMLFVGSALWTTFDQFWGSIMTYIVAALMAPLAPKGRYLSYFCILASLWWIQNPNFLYIFGLLMADLHAAGYVRKLQDHWKPTMLVECGFMALALTCIVGGRNIQFGADDFFGRFTVYEGKYSFDPRQAWPQYMNFTTFVPPLCILVWVEVSHAMQWFASWGLFVWIGKVSYGFYLMQFISLYAIMPPMIIALNDGRGYWDMVVPAYIVTLLFNFFVAWVAYHLLDRTGLKLGKWIWDGLFVTKPKNAAALPFKAVKAFIHMCTTLPGETIRSVGKGSKNAVTKTRTAWWYLFNWRSPTTRPAIPEPTDPEVLAQLNSTRWTSDMSQDREAMHTAKLLRLQQWTWIPHLFLIPGLTLVWTWFHPTGRWTYDALTFSTLWRFIWILSLPNCMFAWLGFCTPDWAHSKEHMDKKPVCREHIRNFFVLLVTKGSNESAVRRGYNKLLPLEKYHPALKVIVLTDEPYVYPDLKNIVCPKNYKSPLGKAKYKARALDYFRYHVSLGSFDWILHMDEESTCDGETLRRCMDFIRYTPHHFGQGIIMYNGEGYWDNWLFTVADGIRVGDDLARFHLQNTVFKRPIFGVHGSFLMTNGEMENECTWDFGSLAEDFEFSQDAWRRGFTCGRIHGIVREQSPQTVRDFLKQRRRWFMGIRDIKGMYGLPNLAINLWIVGVFTLGATVINFPFVAFDRSLTPLWVAIIANFCFMTFYVLYLWGLFIQELDYGMPWYKIIFHLVPAIVIQPIASILEGLSAIWAMSSEDFGKFEVIAKK